VRQDGTVQCWGRNTYGQLGNGTRDSTASAITVNGLRDATDIAVGIDFSCALRRGGTIACWGNNEDGQLGDGRGGRPGAIGLRPVAVVGLRDVLQISLGEVHACAVSKDGRVRCWGNAGNGQIGNDRQRAFNAPLPIGGLAAVREVASGGAHVCALERSGIVKCWGRNTEGQLGDGRSGSRIRPVVVTGLEDAVHVASGTNHSCAVRTSGRVACWGANDTRQLGPAAGGDRKRSSPVAVEGLASVVQLEGGGGHSCARLQSGRVVCWGRNDAGQLGHQSSARFRSQPTPVRGVADAVDIALGTAHTCAARRTGEVACWGNGDDGALGPHPRMARRLTGWGGSETL
jgi:alpha-tubulin suppressor-like RCC1 family protein